MSRLLPLLRGCALLLLWPMMGCMSSPGHWHWPWEPTTTAKAEEYQVPPMEDARYSDPQNLPKSVMKPALPPKDESTAKRGMPSMGGGMGGMGGAGGMGPGAY